MGNEAKVAIVTGAAGGIGEAAALAIAQRGARVAVADLRADAAQDASRRLQADGLNAEPVTVDIADPASVNAMVEDVLGRWGRIDILVNNAGIESSRPFLEIGLEEYERVMRINVTGAWLCCQAVIPVMLRQASGCIVNVSSVAAQRGGGLLGTAAYATSKGAVIALTKALAREFAKSGIRVNAVAPSLTMTDLARRQLEKLDPTTRWSDRVYPDGTWEANLFQFYQRVWPKLSAGLPVPFQLEGGMRRDDTRAHESLREAFVNALIHADYAVPGGVVVERYPDRFVFGNPGTLLVSLEQFRRGGVSECRNKSLQKMFLMIGGGEQAGSGVDKIRSGWRSRHWRAPSISTQSQPDRVQLALPMVSLIPEATLAHLREHFGIRMDTLKSAEVQALATADLEGSVSNARLQELLTDHPVEITRMLSRLCEQGYLISDNRRRWTTYRIVPPTESQNSSHLPRDSSHLPGDSSHLAEDSSHLEKQLSLLPLKEEELRELAKSVARRGKVPSDEMQKVIGLLCKGRFLTAEELATQLNRTPSNLRNRYLTPMVTGGLLKLRYPESPNRPDQAYTATDMNP